MKVFFIFTILFFSSLSAITADSFNQRIAKGASDWMIERLTSDFASVTSESISGEALDRAMTEVYSEELFLVRYQIRTGELFVHSKTPEVSRTLRLEQLNKAMQELADLCRQCNCPLPDSDFIISLHDRFQDYDNFVATVFGFAKEESLEKVILFPDTDTLSNAENLQEEAKKGNAKYPWESKYLKAYWRGASTGAMFTFENYWLYPRFQLVGLSLCYPNYVDARFTIFCQGAETFKQHLSYYLGNSISVPEHMQFKYQILVDGNSCAYSRAYWELFSNSVIMKQESSHIQWYYGALKPYVHYIPVASDFHDLIPKINWARKHDDEVFQITQQAQQFAHENLLREDFYYYMFLALTTYSQVQDYISREE